MSAGTRGPETPPHIATDRSAAGRRSLRAAATARPRRLLVTALLATAALIALAVGTSGARSSAVAEPLLQPGHKLLPPSELRNGLFGSSVALSADGRTALISAPGASGFAGTALVYTRSGSLWTEQAVLIGSEQIEGGPTETCPSESEEVGQCRFGGSVSLSADGNTALIGSPRDNGKTGAAWIFTRAGSTWTQQGPKIVGAGETFEGRFGKSVALSPDGGVALIGGPSDRSGRGSAWVFARKGAEWAQQGTKLVGSGGEGEDHFGWSVALSTNGDTAIVGGPGDATRAGAAWVFTNTGEGWTQEGGKLTPADEAGEGRFGYSVALSNDGDTALVGGHKDSGGNGAAWAYTHSSSGWAQQGTKLTGEAGAEFGYDVALAADGDTALIGAPHAESHLGAAWEFARSEGSWAPLGGRLTGHLEIGSAWFGASVALSGQASTALIGGPHDDRTVGAAWTFLTAGVPPSVTSITPTSGPSAGGTSVTIHGSGFPPGSTVTIGNPATAVNVISETEVTAVTAATPPGSYEVVVSGEHGTSSEGPAYEYLPPSPQPITPLNTGTGGGEGGNTGGQEEGRQGVLGTIASALPAPQLGVTGNLTPVGGIVLVKLPGSKTFVVLTKAQQVPFGTIVNALHGRVTLTSIGPGGRPQSINYYEGIFKLTQRRNGQVVATLVGGNFSICRQAKKGKGATAAATRKSRSKRSVRKLWGNGHGSYSTKGNYAAGAVLGTRWLTEDRCDGTLIRVVTDKVRVTNLVNHRQVTVKAGQSYLAKAP
jgi:hypothetical protein